MSTAKSKKEVLDLLASGKISANEAAKLLNQTEGSTEETAAKTDTAPTPAPKPKAKTAASGNAPSWFRVRVNNTETGQNKVSVNIPLRVLRLGLKIGGRFAPELKDLDWHEINELMADIESGLLVEVQDEENKEHVRVFIE